MEASERALAKSLAREWSDLLPVCMAMIAEVMSSKAEPECCLAAVPAFVHDIVSTMLPTDIHTYLSIVLLAEATDKILRLSLLGLFLDLLVSFLKFFVGFLLSDISCTIPHATVVRQLALVALVVLKLKKSELFKFVIKFFTFLSNTFAFVKTLNDCLMLDTILDHAVHPCTLLNDVISVIGKVFFLSHFLITCRAVNEIAVYCFRRIPFYLHLSIEAISVENMFAAKLNTKTIS